MPSSSINHTAQLCRHPDLIAAEVDGETVMMSIERGEYYGLNPVGTRIWQLLATPLTMSQLEQTLCAEYEVSAEQCQHDLTPFVAEMLARGILRHPD